MSYCAMFCNTIYWPTVIYYTVFIKSHVSFRSYAFRCLLTLCSESTQSNINSFATHQMADVLQRNCSWTGVFLRLCPEILKSLGEEAIIWIDKYSVVHYNWPINCVKDLVFGVLPFYVRTAGFFQMLVPGATSEVCKRLRSHEKYCGRRKNLLEQHQYQWCEPVAVAAGCKFWNGYRLTVIWIVDFSLIRGTDVVAGFLCFCWLLDTSLAKCPQTSLGNMEILSREPHWPLSWHLK